MSRPSGKFIVRVPQELHEALKWCSQKEGISLNEVCRRRLGSEPNSPTVSPLVRQLLALKLPLEGIVLFGSTARGESTASSDVDLLLVLKGGTPVSRILYGAWDDESAKPENRASWKALSPHFVALPEGIKDVGSLWFEVALDGVILWERERVVSAVLYRLRDAMARGRITRKFSHGHPYWVKNRMTNEE